MPEDRVWERQQRWSWDRGGGNAATNDTFYSIQSTDYPWPVESRTPQLSGRSTGTKFAIRNFTLLYVTAKIKVLYYTHFLQKTFFQASISNQECKFSLNGKIKVVAIKSAFLCRTDKISMKLHLSKACKNRRLN